MWIAGCLLVLPTLPACSYHTSSAPLVAAANQFISGQASCHALPQLPANSWHNSLVLPPSLPANSYHSSWLPSVAAGLVIS